MNTLTYRARAPFDNLGTGVIVLASPIVLVIVLLSTKLRTGVIVIEQTAGAIDYEHRFAEHEHDRASP